MERPIKIHQLDGRVRHYLTTVDAFNLPDAVRRWYAAEGEEKYGLSDPCFHANTVTCRTWLGGEVTYVATD